MYSICVISAYFGKLPNYFCMWVKSVAYNSSIDFLLVTDQTVKNTPSNLKIFKMTLDEFSDRASEKIGLPIKVKEAYKCCDFKVAYGTIFADYLDGYDFWGHCDLDLMWGDIRHFATDELLKNYDRFLVLGHLSLYRNNLDVNERYRLSGSNKGNYDKIFLSDKHYAFDELEGIYRIYQKYGFSQYEGHIIADISTTYKRFRCNKDYINYNYQVFYWENGKVFRAYYINSEIKVEEFMYIHWQKRKYKHIDEKVCLRDSIYITRFGFFHKDYKLCSLSEIKKFNPYPGKWYELLELKKQHLLYRLDNIRKELLTKEMQLEWKH